jgi:hypothetical protein
MSGGGEAPRRGDGSAVRDAGGGSGPVRDAAETNIARGL